jgi:diguanylate cyclase (GGDEF)-like protein
MQTGPDPSGDSSVSPEHHEDAERSDPLSRPDAARLSDRDHAASSRDQTAADSDQTAADSDQTASDRDQTASDRDQTASDEDQVASDQESADGADQRARDLGSVRRVHATSVRDEQSQARLRTGVSREINADDRDQTAAQRKGVADVRDTTANTRDAHESPESLTREAQARSGAHDRERAAEDRVRAAGDRVSAAADRNRAAEERQESARDRTLAARDRAQAALEREASEIDELTHVRRRGAGMEQLQKEIDRARRAVESLVVTFVDVDGLKEVNDTEGHLAGDSLLIAVADSLRAGLRSYDLIMRFGGDEFVCVLPNTDVEGVRGRFADVSAALAAGPAAGAITVGFAALIDSDSAEDLIRRADADLLARRGGP